METILIQVHKEEEMKLIETFLKQNRIKNRVLTEDNIEDILLGRITEETNCEEVVHITSLRNELQS